MGRSVCRKRYNRLQSFASGADDTKAAVINGTTLTRKGRQLAMPVGIQSGTRWPIQPLWPGEEDTCAKTTGPEATFAALLFEKDLFRDCVVKLLTPSRGESSADRWD